MKISLSRSQYSLVGAAFLSLLFAVPAHAKVITLACVEDDGFTFHLEIDESRNEVFVNGAPTTKVTISKNSVTFDLDMGDGAWTHLLSRLTGKLVVKSPVTGGWTSPYTCKVASPKF